MPLRERAKNLFKSSRARNGSTSTGSSDSTNHSVYKPGEAMPPPKYRRAPAKEHTEKLEAFSFADSWRKRSFQSSHSPMGTCAQNSRRQSAASVRGLKGRKSAVGGVEHDAEDGAVARLSTEQEVDGDDDVANGELFPPPSVVPSQLLT